MNSDLHSLNEWFGSNKLSLNVMKTNFMTFEGMQNDALRNIKLSINNNDLEKVTKVKFLGVVLDDSLSWREHVHSCKNKIASGIYAINSTKHILTRPHRIKLYNSLVKSHLNYGILLYGSSYDMYLKFLRVQQNKTIRCVYGATYNASAAPLYKELNILNIDSMYKLELGKLMYMHSKSELPTALQSIFLVNIDIHEHNTRARQNAHIVPRNKQEISRSFIHRAPHQWYRIPENVKQSLTVRSFTKTYSKYLLSMQ